MTSVSSLNAAAAAAASSTRAAAPKAEAPRAAAAAGAGPAATVQLSQRALALLKGDKDWQPGMKIDSF